MNYSKVNNIIGWIVFIIAAATYSLTVEPTAGFWDVGEFIAVSYKLMVPHPPGAPLFLLMGRMVSFLAMGDTQMVAFWINMLSAMAAAFGILFMFWSITLIGQKILKVKESEIDTAQMIKLMMA
ncbi:putative membrane protein, partial [hydrothermal vent metagenome]